MAICKPLFLFDTKILKIRQTDSEAQVHPIYFLSLEMSEWSYFQYIL